MVTRILRPMFTFGLFDNPNNGSIDSDAMSDEHTALAEKLALSSGILLKNTGILPLGSPSVITVIGSVASTSPIVAGGTVLLLNCFSYTLQGALDMSYRRT